MANAWEVARRSEDPMSLTLVSPEVVARLRRDHIRMRALCDALDAHVEDCQDPQLIRLYARLRRAIVEHVHLTDGVLDALVVDDVG